MATGIGAVLSTTGVGYIARLDGVDTGLLVLAGAAGTGFVFVLLRESRPENAGE